VGVRACSRVCVCVTKDTSGNVEVKDQMRKYRHYVVQFVSFNE